MKKMLFSVFLVMVSLVLFFPLWILIIQALIPPNEAMLVSTFLAPLLLYTNTPGIEQFEQLIKGHTDLLNILIRDIGWCFSSSCIQVAVSIISGYLLAKYNAYYTKWIIYLYALTLVLPTQMYLVSVYRLTEWIGDSGRRIIMYLMVSFSPLGTIMMRQLFLKLPDEYIEAFRLEDSRFSQILLCIVFPNALPATSGLFLLSFVETWSMVEQPLYLLFDKQQYPLSFLLYDIRTEEPGIIYAASLFALLPISILMLVVLARNFGSKLIYQKTIVKV